MLFLVREELHSVIIDEDVSRATLHLVGIDRFFDGSHSRREDNIQIFFIHWTLNSHTKKSVCDAESLERLTVGASDPLGVLAELQSKTLSSKSDVTPVQVAAARLH